MVEDLDPHSNILKKKTLDQLIIYYFFNVTKLLIFQLLFVIYLIQSLLFLR